VSGNSTSTQTRLPGSPRRQVNVVWDRLTGPAATVRGADRRRQARLLASLLLVIIPLPVVVFVLRALTDPVFRPSPVAAGGLVALVVAYGLSRTHRYQRAASLTMALFPIAIFVIAITNYTPQDFRSLLAYLVLGILLGSILLPLRGVTVLAAVDLIGMLILPLVIPEVTFQIIMPPLTFLGLMSGAILVITQQRNLVEEDRQAELAKSEERYRQSVENSPNAIFSVNQGGIILTWNKACEDVFQYGQGIVGQPYQQLLVNQDDRHGIEDMLTRVLMRHPVRDVDLAIRCRDGTQRFMVSRLYPVLDDKGFVQACVFANTDITERRRTEADLRKAYEELQEADRIKSEMIQNVSHEFRTPLSYIIGYTGILLDEELGIGALTEEQRNFLKIVARQSERLTWLLKNFVAIQSTAEIASGEKQNVPIGPLLEETLQSADKEAAEAQITLSLEVELDLPLVRIQRMAISQVLVNLVSNAMKFTPDGGEVSMRATLDPDSGKVRVAVSDTGPGIPEEYQEHIFERFYQVDGTATREYGGVGLGLALCKEIVEGHGETIWVESTPGQGAKFTFTLPTVPRNK
jgi:PAS domain S-box-containing protein